MAIVSGAASGIGRACAERFRRDGSKVLLFDREPCDADSVDTVSIRGDVSERDSWRAAIELAVLTFGHVDVLVNAAGISSRSLPDPTGPEAWLRTHEVNTLGTWLGMRAVLPLMVGAGHGRIVNVSALAASVPFADSGATAYAASKAAVEAATRAVALEGANKGVLVNAVAPGPVVTQMTSNMSPQVTEWMSAQVPMRRWAQPEEVASVVAFLASEQCTYMTGQVLTVDGGLGIGALNHSIDPVAIGSNAEEGRSKRGRPRKAQRNSK